MRAVIVTEVGGPEELVLTERAEPRPGRGEVSIDVDFAGVGLVDVLFRTGALPLTTPFVPGIEVTGRLREVGEGVPDLASGQRVAALLNDFGRTQRAGGYAEVVLAHHTMTVAVPDTCDLPTVTGALVNGVTAWIALHDIARARPADTVVVLGASGGLGALASRLAALLPCRRVVGVVGRDPTRAPEQCTDVVLTADLDEWTSLDDNTIDIVIDPVGGNARTILFDHLAPFGRHIILGNASGEDVAISSDSTWHGTRTMTGLSLGAIAHLRPDTVRTALTSIIALLDRGLLDQPRPDMQPMSAVKQVHQALADRTAPPKTILDVTR